MIIRRVDNGMLELLHEKSRNEVWFICEKCECGYRQSFATYFNQSPGKLCYNCRRKEIASRKDVKEKQSNASKETWKKQEYQEKMSKASSDAQNRRWAKVPKEERNKNCLIPFQRYVDFFSNHPGFTLISTEETYLATKKVEYTCPNGHLNTERFSTTASSKPPCKQCIGIDVGKIKEELEKLGHEFISLEKRTTQHTLTVKCNKGHIFSKTYGNWRADHSCKVCAGNSFDLNEIITEFAQVGYEVVNSNDFKGAIKRHEFTLRCHQGHVFNLSYLSFRNGSRCEECVKVEKYDKYKTWVESRNFKLLDSIDEFYSHREFFNFECDYGHIHSMFWTNFHNNQGCGLCAGTYSVSTPEYELRNIFDLYNIKYEASNRSILKGKELDLYFPDHNIAIEYNGYPWHTELNGKDKKYHIYKTNECEQNNIQLIHLFYDEWETKRELIIKKLLHIFNKTNEEKIYARKCTIKEIEVKEAKVFCETYHIQKYGRAKIRLGLFYENVLVSVMTFSKGNIAKGNKAEEGIWELNRYCTSKQVIGGANKLISFFKKNYEWKKIFTYADRRWSRGNLYYKMNFTFIKNTEPNYWYIDPKNNLERLYRFKFRRSELEGEGTEWEIMQQKGYDRIWDCGHMLFEIENNI